MKRSTTVLGFVLCASACGVGDGSDIGPELAEIPDVSCRFLVLDDQGRGVVGATVSIDGTPLSATTGRNGRGDWLAEPRGRQIVRVDARHGAATNGDELGAFAVATTIAGIDLPTPLFVPDFPDAATTTVTAGTQPGLAVVASAGGTQLGWAGGTSIGTADGATTIELRLGDLQAHHLPGTPPLPATGARFFSRGLWIEPANATFTPPAVVDMADDLQLGGGQAVLYHFDPATGEWEQVAAFGSASGGRITASGVTGGGLWVFAADLGATTVAGRIVDASPAANPVADAMVRVDHRATTTDATGRFVADGIAPTKFDGSPRSCTIEVFAGGSWLPVRRATTASVSAAALEIGDFVLDTVPCGNVRVQQVLRGRAEALSPARISSLFQDVALATTSDAQGQVTFEDLPWDYFGFQDGRPRDTRDVYYGQAIGFLERGRRWLDAYQFFQQREWYRGGRRSQTYVSDAFGGGPLYGAAIVQGNTPGAGWQGDTREGGVAFITRDFSGRATATRRSERDGQVLVHAFSIAVPNGDHVELPLRRVLRTPLAAFARHGLVAGSLVGADGSRQHELRSWRRLSAQEWWDDVIEDLALPTTLPVDLDPATTHAAFQAGVPTPGGHLVAIEYTTPGGAKTLQKLAIAADLEPIEGATAARDLSLESTADTTFAVPGALTGADPELDLAQLQLALALRQPSGRVVPVARDLTGNHAVAGADLAFTLPALVGALDGHGWLALLHGSYAGSGGSTLGVDAMVSLPRANQPSIPTGNVAFGTFPVVSSPAPGATVPASGFTVQFALPANALHGLVELRSTNGGETLLWQAVVPRDLNEFAFVSLPVEAATPLLAGRTYTLTVSAVFGDGIVTGTPEPYRDLSTFLQSIGAVERGASQVLRRSFTVTTN
ncbi:MAG: hypothetical protein JNK15_11620 [Planctomycetes bacterium]|nr:hypothetical protein [Planctomycetota bacterium]